MKKFIIAVSLLTSALYSNAQSLEQKTLYKSNTGFDIQMAIRNMQDTTVYFYYGFQNKKYSSITDIGSVFFVEKEQVEKFANTLINLAERTEKTNLQVSVGNVKLALYDFSTAIYIEDKNGKYTTLTPKAAKQMAADILNNVGLLRK